MREPNFKGPCGSAWRVAMPTNHERPDTTATLGMWLLTVPGAHPAWHSYALAVIHLRDIAGVRPAVKRIPDATHEVLLFALDPGVSLPDPDDGAHFRPAFLSPANLVEQMQALTDEQAVAIVEGLARAFVDGHASPDTDFRSQTQALLRSTVEHVVLGGHPQGNA